MNIEFHTFALFVTIALGVTYIIVVRKAERV